MNYPAASCWVSTAHTNGNGTQQAAGNRTLIEIERRLTHFFRIDLEQVVSFLEFVTTYAFDRFARERLSWSRPVPSHLRRLANPLALDVGSVPGEPLRTNNAINIDSREHLGDFQHTSERVAPTRSTFAEP